MRRHTMIAGIAILALGLGACGGSADGRTGDASGGTGVGNSSDSSEADADVTIEAFDFQPMETTVQMGATVRWENQDDILHTVTSGEAQKQGVPGVTENSDAEPDGMFDSELDGEGASFEFTFDEAGSFDYFCSIHPGMAGTINVE